MKSKTELLADIDRVTAERDAALAELDMVRKAVPNSTLELVSLQQRLKAADELLTDAIALLECVTDTGELTREDHSELEAEICEVVKRFWSRNSEAIKPAEAEKRIQRIECSSCKGKGLRVMGGEMNECPSCDGEGYKP